MTPLPEVNPLVYRASQGRPDNCISSLRPTRPCVWDATVSLHTARRTLAPPPRRPGELGAQHTVRTAKVVSGLASKRYVLRSHWPLLPTLPNSSSCCADLPCSNPERGCTPDSSIHKTLPRPPSSFDHLITRPSHPSRPNQRNFNPARTTTLCTRRQHQHLPIASAS